MCFNFIVGSRSDKEETPLTTPNITSPMKMFDPEKFRSANSFQPNTNYTILDDRHDLVSTQFDDIHASDSEKESQEQIIKQYKTNNKNDNINTIQQQNNLNDYNNNNNSNEEFEQKTEENRITMLEDIQEYNSNIENKTTILDEDDEMLMDEILNMDDI